MQRRISLSVLAFGAAALDVGEGGRVAAHPGDGDDVDGAVELAVAEAVEPVAVGPAGGDWDRGRTGQHRERCLAADPPGVRPGQQDLGSAERADAVLCRGQFLNNGSDLGFDICRSLIERGDPLAKPDQSRVKDTRPAVGTARAGQAGACPRPSVTGQAAQFRGGRGR